MVFINRQSNTHRMRYKIFFFFLLAALFAGSCAAPFSTANPPDTAASSQDDWQDAVFTTDAYYQSQLSGRDLDVYQRLLAGVSTFAPSIDFPYTLDQQTLNQAVYWLSADHPELYWFNGGGSLNVRQILFYQSSQYRPAYVYDQSQTAARAPALQQATADFLACTQGLEEEYDLALAIYRQVILGTQYQTGAADNQNLCSVLLNGASVCSGYAKTMQYLLQKVGIQAAYVSGQLLESGESHAWLLMRLDGEYYFADPTLGDPTTEANVPLPAEAYIDYAWFGLNSAEMAQTHAPLTYLPLPACTAESANYYRAEGLYLESYCQQALLPLLQRSWQQGEAFFTFRLASDDGFAQAQADLLDAGGAFDLFRQAGMPQTDLLYTVNENKRIITLYF